jgi:hypothetical protein
MSMFRIISLGEMVQVIETDGLSNSTAITPFRTRKEAREWALGRLDGIARKEQAIIREEIIRTAASRL